MDAEQTAIATTCLNASYDGSMSFPEIVGTLINTGFEGYAVDYRRHVQTYYLPNSDNVELPTPHTNGAIAAQFSASKIEALVRWAQADEADYSYAAFCEKVMAAGCAGYVVSFLGKRVVYFGRTAETHVELFPQ